MAGGQHDGRVVRTATEQHCRASFEASGRPSARRCAAARSASAWEAAKRSARPPRRARQPADSAVALSSAGSSAARVMSLTSSPADSASACRKPPQLPDPLQAGMCGVPPTPAHLSSLMSRASPCRDCMQWLHTAVQLPLAGGYFLVTLCNCICNGGLESSPVCWQRGQCSSLHAADGHPSGSYQAVQRHCLHVLALPLRPAVLHAFIACQASALRCTK